MRVDLLMEALPIMGTGYLGIFIVTGVIILAVSVLRKLTDGKNAEQEKENDQ